MYSFEKSRLLEPRSITRTGMKAMTFKMRTTVSVRQNVILIIKYLKNKIIINVSKFAIWF